VRPRDPRRRPFYRIGLPIELQAFFGSAPMSAEKRCYKGLFRRVYTILYHLHILE
jgi:hypothetical protein